MDYFLGFLTGFFFCILLIGVFPINITQEGYTQHYFYKGVEHAETQYLLRCYELGIKKEKCQELIKIKE